MIVESSRTRKSLNTYTLFLKSITLLKNTILINHATKKPRKDLTIANKKDTIRSFSTVSIYPDLHSLIFSRKWKTDRNLYNLYTCLIWTLLSLTTGVQNSQVLLY